MATPNLDDAAAIPAEASTAAGRVAQHDLNAQIAYDRYKAAKAARAIRGGIVFSKIIPASPVSDAQGTLTGASGHTFDQPGS